ncbi:MAG: DUF5668 domain-containing protein [Bacteroidia bacterium]|jgi:predicted membrane protein
MDVINKKDEQDAGNYTPNNRGKVAGGLIIVSIGVVMLLRELGYDIPHWLISWKTLLIVIGFYIGIKHKFRNPGWFLLMAVGGVFLLGDIYPEYFNKSFIWPVVVILAGLFILFKPRRQFQHCRQWRRGEHDWKQKWEWENKEGQTDEDMIETVSIFAGVKKHILSKNFKGGDVVCVFGGAEVNLMQADFTGKAVMELTQVFGGTKLIVPAHWDIQHHDLVAVMGGIEDKRPVHADPVQSSDKVLVLRGTCLFGGIEIKSY